MSDNQDRFSTELENIRDQGLYKNEHVLKSAQRVNIKVDDKGEVINFCANNYLGLADHPVIVEAACEALRTHGFGMASVRFICGTQDLHKNFEQYLAKFLGKDDVVLYSSCFDANTGLFEALFDEKDAVISDALNHASIIDGIRLCKAARFRYAHSDMNDLETQLQAAQSFRQRLIVTDGVFSMDGDIAKLNDIVTLAERYGALVMIDDSHATGVIGNRGKGSAEFHGVLDKIDIITSTLGKALGGGAGGFTAARQSITDILRQKSRPYLFSNSLAPALVAGGIKALEILHGSDELRRRLSENTTFFRDRLSSHGFNIKPGEHPIIPVMLYDADLAQRMAQRLLDERVYVIGFSYPVVPKEQARIRVQISAAHKKAQLINAVDAFAKVGKELGVTQ